jgi:hypothetical protein
VKCQRSVVDDDVPGDVIRLLGEDYLRLTMWLIKTYMKLQSGPKI